MSGSRKSLWLAIAVFFVWIAFTIGIGSASAEGETDIGALVASKFAWGIFAAGLFLIAVIVISRRYDAALRAPRWRALWLLWFPALYLLIFVAIAIALGLPSGRIMLFLSINALMVGVSEELMFRGVLFSALRGVMRVWPAAVLSSGLFGLVHVLNALLTGMLLMALVQACAATMSGFLLLSLRLRTGSIWPCVIFHMLWDLSSLMILQSQAVGGAVTGPAPAGAALVLPLLMVLPNALYALWLLRGMGRTTLPGDVVGGRQGAPRRASIRR